MLERTIISRPEGLRQSINDAYCMDEYSIVSQLIEQAALDDAQYQRVREKAKQLTGLIREKSRSGSGIDSLLTEYALSSDEGIALMCLAEAFLRVPDNATIDNLIKDKIADADWRSHKGKSPSMYVNATTWALMLTGKILKPSKAESLVSKALTRFFNRSSEPVIRKAIHRAMQIMSRQFVMGKNIDDAVERAKKKEDQGYLYSYDMLGEAALTRKDAERYFQDYSKAIAAIGKRASKDKDIFHRPGISIKLSALHPRYFESQRERVIEELSASLLALAKMAKDVNIALTVDAEESERLELSLDVIEKVFSNPELQGWDGFGLAVQSYQKRAFYLIDWVAALARKHQRRIMVRLIKGAYWDSEIKNRQMLGDKDYPVFTRKPFTDVSFQACAKKILGLTDAIFPQFATHNAYSVAMILELVGDYRDFEFQCLHGMGTDLYNQIVPKDKENIPCRIYAPVGSHEDLLPYLVRRLLENGANSSFVNRIVDEKMDIDELIIDPVEKSRQLLSLINKNIPLPENIFQALRKNSRGFDLTNRKERADMQQRLNAMDTGNWHAQPMIPGFKAESGANKIYSPQNQTEQAGEVIETPQDYLEKALNHAGEAFKTWSKTSVEARALILENIAERFEKNHELFYAMACLEAGKTWNDGIAEVREAVDFCRYYAAMARKQLAEPLRMTGYTGETNELSLHPRGTVLCISPWNFPLAIFTGQVVAALVTGNCVIAKPAEQTPLIAALAVKLMHEAGVPEAAVQLLPGTGEAVAAPLVKDKRIHAVMFTGSTETANKINQSLATRGGPIAPFIAETGGQNVMIVDSSALLEQVANDVLLSAFGSAGQRCSALRVLYVQEEVYPRMIELLKGAMAELKVGNPAFYDTDVGPVIDKDALGTIMSHIEKMAKNHEIIYQCELTDECRNGFFVPPTAIAIDSIQTLEREVFGPVLHVISYKRTDLDKVIDEVNNTGYGLTLGIHSRINQTIQYIRERIHAGNCYVNRNMIGAVVGLQPFGGEGLSGTGPKAGGPHYLQRLCNERTYTENTTAAGGNASLMSIDDEV